MTSALMTSALIVKGPEPSSAHTAATREELLKSMTARDGHSFLDDIIFSSIKLMHVLLRSVRVIYLF